MRTLTIQLTKSDYAACGAYISEALRRRAPHYAWVYVSLLAAFLMAVVGFGGMLSFASKVRAQHQWAYMVNVILLAGAAVLYFATAYLARLSLTSIVYKSDTSLLAPFDFIPDESGIVISTANVRTETKWRGIERMVIHGAHLYLFYQPNFAYIVPERVFSSRSDFEAYAQDLFKLSQVNRA